MCSCRIISFLLVVLACQQTKQSPSLITEEFKYSAYTWYYTPNNWDFYVDYYLSIDKTGNYKVMLRDSMSRPNYYTGSINDSIRNLINKTFQVDTFKTDYQSNAIQNISYNGFTYCFDYKKARENRKRITFIQSHSPFEIKTLSLLLDTLVRNTSANKVDTLDITQYEEELKNFSSASLGPFPEMEKPKFKPEKTPK